MGMVGLHQFKEQIYVPLCILRFITINPRKTEVRATRIGINTAKLQEKDEFQITCCSLLPTVWVIYQPEVLVIRFIMQQIWAQVLFSFEWIQI